MKSSKELFKRLGEDEAFAKEFSDAVRAKRESGASSYFDTMIPAAAEFGYELSEEELQTVADSMEAQMSEEELGKVAGGTSCLVTSVSISLISTTILSSVATTIIGTEGTFDDDNQG